MDNLPMLPLLVRWLHLVCACLAVGGPFFLRYVLIPAGEATLDAPAQARVREAVSKLWGVMVHALITLFILSGLYTFFYVVLPMDLGRWKALYHALFGLKMMLSLVIFFLASVLPGRSQAFAFIRAKSKFYLSAMLVMLFVVLMLANGLRAIRDRALLERKTPPATTAPIETI